MGTGISKLWLKLGIGTIAGIAAYRFSKTERFQQVKDKVFNTLDKMTGEDEVKKEMYISGKR